jgi:hypothetical protein
MSLLLFEGSDDLRSLGAEVWGAASNTTKLYDSRT